MQNSEQLNCTRVSLKQTISVNECMHEYHYP